MAMLPNYYYLVPKVKWVDEGAVVTLEDHSDADVVEVVRCRECQKWEKKYELDNGQVFGACDRFYGAVTEDSFFCRDGQ